MSKPVSIWIYNKKTKKKEEYYLVLLRVEEELENGKPDTVTIGRDHDTFELSEDASKNKFITAFIRKEDY